MDEDDRNYKLVLQSQDKQSSQWKLRELKLPLTLAHKMEDIRFEFEQFLLDKQFVVERAQDRIESYLRG